MKANVHLFTNTQLLYRVQTKQNSIQTLQPPLELVLQILEKVLKINPNAAYILPM